FGKDVQGRTGDHVGAFHTVGFGLTSCEGETTISFTAQHDGHVVPGGAAAEVSATAVRPPAKDGDFRIQCCVVGPGLDDQRVGGSNADHLEGGVELIEGRNQVFVVVGAGLVCQIEAGDHDHDEVSNADRAAIVPGDRVEHILGVVDGALEDCRLRLRVIFACGQEALLFSVPFSPGVVGDDNFRLEGDVDPIERGAHGEAFLDDDVGALGAARNGQAGVGVSVESAVINTALDHVVEDPVGATNGVPRLGEDAGQGNAHGAANPVCKADCLRPEGSTADAGCQVGGHSNVVAERNQRRTAGDPDAV